MGMSETASIGTAILLGKAAELGAAVLKEKTPNAARAYIGHIAELDPTVYRPAEGELELALKLATELIELGEVPSPPKISPRFFGNP